MPHATLAEELIRQVVDCLDDAWYRTAIVVNDVALWDVAAAEPDQLLIPPPYKLTARQRAHLLGVLEEFSESSRFGPRLFPRGTWVTDSSEVCRWLTSHPASNPICTSTNSAVLSPVHGDLNSNNILLWLERSQPFLIDFACFQSRGHTLQDFARLEVEVKFTLMDRDQDSTLDALDHTPAQLTRWCELEKQLTSTDWSAAVISASSDSLPIQRAANLIIDIRQRANAVHSTAYTRAGVARSHFLIEYNAALLYHTLRAIGYDTLSPFKRLLAVYSAARLIRSFEMR
ncbi:MAG: hypothetical protein HZA88_20545 [Verrucomicrobia bacterium]|nr:hypothetical protein [Verrucomicrobiota bacterium]